MGWLVGGGLTRVIGAMPSGAVVAFDLQDGCPGGWSVFHEGAGRFLISAVTKDQIGKIPSAFASDDRHVLLEERLFRIPGGAQRHKLTMGELPPYPVPLIISNNGGPGWGVAATDGGQVTGAHARSTAALGEGKEFNILPPFVPLFFL